MKTKDRKAKREQLDDIDIFEVGPATNPFIKEAGLIDAAIPTQEIIDIDPLYGGIQQQKDEKPGDQFSRDLARGTLGILEKISPSDETIKSQEEQRLKNQQIFNLILETANLEPGSFEANKLLADLKKDPKFQTDLGFDQGSILTGGGTLDSPTYGLYDISNFLLGDARRGLSEMTEQGTKYQDLPIEQKLGIAILPIDALDIAGLAFLAKAPIGSLMRAGQKAFGKGSKLTVKDLTNNKEFMQNYLKENPNAIKALKEYGLDIQTRFASGPPTKPRTPKSMERDPLGLLDDNEMGFGKGQSAFNKNLPSQLEVDDKLKRAALEAQELKKETDKLKQVDPSLKKAAQEADKKVEDFSKQYEAAYGNKSNRLRALEKLKRDYGAEEFERLENLAIQKGLSKKRNLAPKGSVKKTTPEGEKFIKENAAKLSATELKLAMTQDEATAAKFFYTDGMGNVKIPPDSFFRQYPSAQFGIIREGDVGTKGGKAKSEIAQEADQKIYDQFDIFTGVEGFNMNDPRAVREAFAKAFVSDASQSKFSGFAITSQDPNFRRALARKINDYNKSKGFGEFDKTKGYEEGRVYNKNQIAEIDRYLRVGDGSKEKTAVQGQFFTYLNTNDTYNNLVQNMKRLEDDFYPIVPGKPNPKRDFTKKLKRYLNFVRETSAELRDPVQGSFDPFMKKFNEDMLALLDPSSIEYQNFLKFSYHDKIREEVGNLAKPALDQIFKAPKVRPNGSIRTPEERVKEAKNSIQIAHTFESSQVGETVGENLVGSGMIPGSYYLDLSNYNAIKQPQLEKRARAAVDEFEATGDRSKLDQVSMELEELGAEVTVGDFTLGRHKTLAEKLTDLIGGPPGSPERELLKQKTGVTDEQIAQLEQAIDLLNEAGLRTGKVTAMQSGGLVKDVEDIFEEEDQIMEGGKIFPRISIEFGDAARGTARRFGEEPSPLEDIEPEQPAPVERTSAEPQEKMFDVQPTENIFTGEMEQANLKFPFWKLFTKPPKNETAPIPTPKESLDNPTKKQKESLELEKEKTKDEPPLDPTPEDDIPLTDDVMGMDIAVTPKSQTPITGVFYSDIERVLARPDTPAIFPNKKALLDFLKKNRIRDSEFRDYQIDSLLRIFDENTPIPKAQVIEHLRQAPIRGMHVHATGQFSEVINPNGAVDTRYPGYAESGFIDGTQRERVLYIPTDKFPGDSGTYPSPIFQGERIENHKWGMPNQDNAYVIGWTRLTDRMAILPTKIGAPKSASKIPGLTRERERVQRQVAGLYAEAINKLNREGVRRGLNQGDLDLINELSLEQIMTQYGDTLNEISPGLLDQIDELIVKVRDIDDQITKGSTVDTSGIVKVTFADEIQSDIMQAAAGRKQKLLATLRKIADEGRESTTLPELSRIGNDALAFFEENKSVFRPLRKSQTEVDIIGDRLAKYDAEVDEIINRYIETRELDPATVKRLQEALNENINNMIDELMQIDTKTYDGLFPDLPFKKREEWADALIKKDLFELAYRKFILKDPNVPDYYAVSPQELVINRYSFKGDSSTPADVRAADKKRQIDYFMARGEFIESEYKGVGMSEFYGGPNAKDPNGKHYTSTIEKILKTQAKQNNSEFVVLNVQTKSGAKDLFRITDQNGNMVATLTDRRQAEIALDQNPNYRMETVSVPTDKNTTPSFAIKITEEMLEPYKTHKAKGGLVSMIDIFEVA